MVLFLHVPRFHSYNSSSLHHNQTLNLINPSSISVLKFKPTFLPASIPTMHGVNSTSPISQSLHPIKTLSHLVHRIHITSDWSEFFFLLSFHPYMPINQLGILFCFSSFFSSSSSEEASPSKLNEICDGSTRALLRPS